MADTVSKEKRSETMQAIKSKDSAMESFVRKELKKKGCRFKTNVSKMRGKPDIVFAKKKVVIFLDSCFWHGCKQHCRMPKTSRDYWKNKIENNKKRDSEINKFYKKEYWQVLRFWEHEIRKNSLRVIDKIQKILF